MPHNEKNSFKSIPFKYPKEGLREVTSGWSGAKEWQLHPIAQFFLLETLKRATLIPEGSTRERGNSEDVEEKGDLPNGRENPLETDRKETGHFGGFGAVTAADEEENIEIQHDDIGERRYIERQ